MHRASSPRRSVALFAAWLLPLAVFAVLHPPADAAAPTAPPTISRFSPAQGPVGSTVTISGSNFRPPLVITFGGNVLAAASSTGEELTVTVPADAQTGPIKVTTSAGSVSTPTSFTIGAVLPVVTLAATVPRVSVDGGINGMFTLSLPAPAASDLTVNYFASGSAVGGTDYVKLKGTAKIKAGRASQSIKIVPEGNLDGADKKVVKLALLPGSGYTVGTTTVQKVKIVAGQ